MGWSPSAIDLERFWERLVCKALALGKYQFLSMAKIHTVPGKRFLIDPKWQNLYPRRSQIVPFSLFPFPFASCKVNKCKEI